MKIWAGLNEALVKKRSISCFKFQTCNVSFLVRSGGLDPGSFTKCVPEEEPLCAAEGVWSFKCGALGTKCDVRHMCNTYSNISHGFSKYSLLGPEQRATMGGLLSISLTEIVNQIGAWLLEVG